MTSVASADKLSGVSFSATLSPPLWPRRFIVRSVDSGCREAACCLGEYSCTLWRLQFNMENAAAPLASLRALSGPKYLQRGLQELGVREDSDKSVLHHWARRLPRGMFDGHRSVMPAPDHLIFHGLTKSLITGLFAELSSEDALLVGTSFRDALARSHMPCTRIYNPTTRAVVSVGISEWAASLTVASVVFRRVLPGASPSSSGAATPLQVGVQMLDAFTALVNALYFFPRAELDGETTCRTRLGSKELRRMGEKFFKLVCTACLRGDTAALGRSVDKPNLHRLRELLDHVVPALQHIRHAQELLFENAHQPVKRAITTGNGWDDAGRAMERVRQCELASRLLAEPSFFGVPPEWLAHQGIQAALSKAHALHSQPSGPWKTCGRRLVPALVPVAGQELAMSRFGSSSIVKWWGRASRSGAADKVQLGDALAVLVLPSAGLTAVNVAYGTDSGHPLARTAYFSIAAVLTTPHGTCSAVVHPFLSIAGSSDVSVDVSRVMYLPLDCNVRRALVLHSCQHGCSSLRSAVGHSGTNRWRVLGRADGYPSRHG